MEETDIDMWIVTSQESNEDPVIKTMMPYSSWKLAGRRTILVFYRHDDGLVERINIYKPGLDLDRFYKSVWTNDKDGDWTRFSSFRPEKSVNANGNKGVPETQEECLKRIIDERNPKKIGLNFALENNYGDGISHGSYLWIVDAIGSENASKIVSANALATRWLETRIPEEMDAYKSIVQLTAEIITVCMSGEGVQAGITTCDDLAWYIAQRFEDMGLHPCFGISVTIRRDGAAGLSGDTIILEGDNIHCDAGFEYLGLLTDMQHNAYVLRRSEVKPPAGLVSLFEQSKRIEQIQCDEIRPGRTGNEALQAILSRAKEEGIDCMIYTHSLGNYVHSAGPSIGRVDNQRYIKDYGEMVIHDNTVYANEFCVIGTIPEWHDEKIIMLCETDCALVNGKTELLYRQPCMHIVK
jgi:hypothetical protein